MTATTRTQAMLAARAKASHDKRQRVLAAVQALEAAGTPVTPAAVAAAARVSTWLVYADGVASTSKPPGNGRPSADTLPNPRPRRPAENRSPRPACAPTSPSPRTRSAGSAPNATSYAAVCASSSAPRSTGPTALT